MMLSKLTQAALAVAIVAGMSASLAHAVDEQKVMKDIRKEDKNIHVEHVQKMKKDAEADKLRRDNAEHRNIFVKTKDKMIYKYHKRRLRHETRKGAKLEHKIHHGG